MEFKKPEIQSIKYWRVKRSIGLFILLSIVAAIYSVLRNFEFFEIGSTVRIIVTIVMLLLIAYQIISIFIYPVIEYRQWEYAITDDRVEIRHGIFFIERTVIPIVRIQNINTNQGPVQRSFGLYSVELALASGTFDIVGLSKETAEDISEKLNARLRSRLTSIDISNPAVVELKGDKS